MSLGIRLYQKIINVSRKKFITEYPPWCNILSSWAKLTKIYNDGLANCIRSSNVHSPYRCRPGSDAADVGHDELDGRYIEARRSSGKFGARRNY